MKRKWERWVVDEPSRLVLEDTYSHTPFPDPVTRSSLAVLLGTKPRRIQVWFQNKRQRDEGKRREREDREERKKRQEQGWSVAKWKGEGDKVSGAPVVLCTAVTACANAIALRSAPSELFPTVAATTPATPTMIAHAAAWNRVLSGVAPLSSSVSLLPDDALIVAATAYLLHVAHAAATA